MASNRIKDGNFIVIQSFMRKQLNLKGNELLVFACIYGFSQAEDQKFSGSIQYIADWIGCNSKNTVVNCLKSLVERNLIIKEDKVVNNVKFCEYQANLEYIKNCYTTPNNDTDISKNGAGGISKNGMGGISKNGTNKINNNIPNNINKNKYGQFQNVLLTNEELEKLKSRFPDWHARIEKLSLYIESKGAKYKSHYATILNWANSEVKKNGSNKKSNDEYPE